MGSLNTYSDETLGNLYEVQHVRIESVEDEIREINQNPRGSENRSEEAVDLFLAFDEINRHSELDGTSGIVSELG